MMKKILLLLFFMEIAFLSFTQNNCKFVSLFNGKDLSGWLMEGEVPGFEVIDGVLVAKKYNGSNLFTTNRYANFIFKFEYLLSPKGNSGVLIRCDPKKPWETGYEIQLLAPWTPYRDDLHCTGSVYGYVPVMNRPDETTGIWHQMEIRCDRTKITISVDGQVTTMAGTDTVQGMKEKWLSGAIGFQSNHSKEGEYAMFRNIHICDFDADPEYVKKGFYEQDARIRKQAHEAATELGGKMIGTLVLLMDTDEPKLGSGAKKALFDITAKATDPHALKNEKKWVIKEIHAGIKKSSTETTKAYLRWLLEMTK